jgi:TldD protein
MSGMDPLLPRALDTARLKGAQYADIRLINSVEQSLAVKNGHAGGLSQVESLGFGVRALVNGAWGFAASHTVTAAEVDRVTALAVNIARASATTRHTPVRLGPPVTSRGTYVTPFAIDPFAVPIEDKLALLLRADEAMARVPEVDIRFGSLVFSREHKLFANTDGAQTEQTIVESGGGILATAIADDEVQRRSYPNSAERQQGTAGWEYILALQLPEHAERIATEAAQLLHAAECPHDTVTTVILGAAQLAQQIHESCGHPTELDRVFGAEADFAGGSFLTPEKLGRYRYGSEHVNLTADAVQPAGLGTLGWDDEGVPATRTPLVRDGVFVGYLTSRETAARLGAVAGGSADSNGHLRAESWARLPLVRMCNLSLEPGAWSLADLIADTDEGVFMDTNRSWSIDDQRYNFQFGAEVGYEIKNGKLGRLLRNCTYTGNTPEFWRSCDAVCNRDHWALYGTPNCGKGQPIQVMRTGHGASPARFRKVRVGVLGE